MGVVLFVIVLSLLVLLISRWYIQTRKFVNCLRNIPGPPPLPIIGNALDLISSKGIVVIISSFYLLLLSTLIKLLFNNCIDRKRFYLMSY